MTTNPPPGWYPDPDDPSSDRYWDGGLWTHYTVPAAAQGSPNQVMGTPSVRWQYAVVNLGALSTGPRLGAALGYLGRNGWEIAATFDRASNWLADMEKGFVIFKRPVREGEEPDGPWGKVWSSEEIRTALTNAESLLDELEKLTELRDSGVMSERQFAVAEARIMSSLAQ